MNLTTLILFCLAFANFSEGNEVDAKLEALEEKFKAQGK